jgi:putative salt-induced outer membrane protein YdiY
MMPGKKCWFGAGRYEDDRFSAFDFQASLSTGLGYRIINSERTKFWVQRFLVESGSDNTYVQNDLGLEVTITGALGLRLVLPSPAQHRRSPGCGEDRYSHHGRIDLRNQVSSPA